MKTSEETKHELKTWPEYYQAIKRGEKTFEIRKHDRTFEVGNKLLLREYKLTGINKVTQQIEGEYTGDEMEVTITYILKHYPMHNNFGLEEGHCIMGFSILTTEIDRLNKENERARELLRDAKPHTEDPAMDLLLSELIQSFLNESKAQK